MLLVAAFGRLFMGHLASRQAPQLVINERQQLLRGVRVALLNALENACDFAHANRWYQNRAAVEVLKACSVWAASVQMFVQQLEPKPYAITIPRTCSYWQSAPGSSLYYET